MDFAVLRSSFDLIIRRSSLELELIVGCLTSNDNVFYTYAGREQVLLLLSSIMAIY